MSTLAIDQHFAVERQVGRGAFGEVLRAVDRKTGRPVAIKRLLGSMNDNHAIERFEREMQMVAKINSPYVVKYVAHGHDGQQRLCLVLEWLDGLDLARWRKRNQITLEIVLGIARQAALGLDAIHRAGIVHRDVKPSNFFVMKAGHTVHVKIIDLGIARASSEPTLTAEGVRIGTPAYMSPEQARGESRVGPQSDIYSLGVVIYELLTGARLYPESDPFAILARIVLQDPPPIQNKIPDLAPVVSEMLNRCLQRDPAKRFQNARHLVDAIDRACDQIESTIVSIYEPPTGMIEAPVPSTIMMPLAGEQRVMTAVFVELPPVDPGRTPTAMEEFQRIVESFEGTAFPLVGGRAIGAFGQMRSGGDEPVRAARAALAVKQLFPVSRLALATTRMRVNEGGVSGDAIDRGVEELNRATRFIRLDNHTVRMLEGRFEIRPHDNEDKGALLVGEGTSTLETRQKLLGRQTPTVGREREIATLESVLDECVNEQVARAILVTAPAGVGKSRLVQEWMRRFSRKTNPRTEPYLLIARGDPVRANTPFGMIAQLVRSGANLTENQSDEHARELITRWVTAQMPRSLRHDQQRVIEFLGEIAGVRFPDEGRVQLRSARADGILMGDQMRRAWEDLLAAIAPRKPVVLVLEDLHWADLPSIRAIDGALRLLENQSFFVLALARPEVHERFEKLWHDRGVQELRLPVLSRRACEQLVRDVLGNTGHDQDFARIVEQAGGNAFFLEELIRAVADGDGHQLPETVMLMVQARLQRLDPEMRNLLRAGSVFGQTFWRGGIDALIGATRHPAQLEAQLTRLVELEMIVARDNGRFANEREYTFRHALVRDAAYATLAERDREIGHRIAGEWLELTGERDAGVLAEHYQLSGNRENALKWFQRAAEEALAGHDLDGVLQRCEQVIGAGAQGPLLGAMRLLQAEAHTWKGAHREAVRCARAASESLKPSFAAWFQAVGELAFAAGRAGDLVQLKRAAQLLFESDSDERSRGSQITAMARTAARLLYAGQRDLADKLFRRIERLSPSEGWADPEVNAHVGRAKGLQAFMHGDLVTSLQLQQHAASDFETAGNLRNACEMKVDIARGWVDLGAYDRAEPMLRAALDDAERMRLTAIATNARALLGLVLAMRSELEVALGMLAIAAESYAQQGNHRMEGTTRMDLSRVLRMRNELTAAETEARRAVEILASAPATRVAALAELTEVLLLQRNTGEALATIAPVEPLLRHSMGLGEREFAVRLAFAEALASNGLWDQAIPAIETAMENLRARAVLITDDSLRGAFLQSVPEHIQIARLYQHWTASRNAV